MVASTFSRMGMAKAAVLPVPVWAWAKGSRPACRTGLAGGGVTEGDDRRDRGFGRNAQVLTHPIVLVGAHRIRTAADTESPRRHHHVLRHAPGVETEAFVQEHDRDRDRTPVEVPRRHHRSREIVPMFAVHQDDETPRLAVLGAPGRSAGLQDLCKHVLRYRTIEVLAYLALRNDSQI